MAAATWSATRVDVPARTSAERGSGPARIAFWLMAGLTALALAAVAVDLAPAVRAPAGSGDGGAEPAAALVRRFYDAVNATLATGDPAPLTALLTPDFADHRAQQGHAATRAAFARRVLALRATFPTAWLVVEDLHPHGEWVLARLRVEGAAPSAVLGLTVADVPASWEAVEFVRVAGGQVAERRAAGDWPVLFEPLAQAPVPEPPAEAFARLGRLTYGPGASQPRIAALGPLLVAVEAGTLTVVAEGEAVVTRATAAESSAASAGELVLGAGDALALAAGVRYAVRNAGPAPAGALALALLPPDQAGMAGKPSAWWEAWLPGVTVHPLAEGVVEGLPPGPVVLAMGRVALAAGAALTAAGASGPRLVAVEVGTLELEAADGPPSLLAAGQGSLVQRVSGATLRSAGDGPLVLLVVAIAPAEEAPAAG